MRACVHNMALPRLPAPTPADVGCNITRGVCSLYIDIQNTMHVKLHRRWRPYIYKRHQYGRQRRGSFTGIVYLYIVSRGQGLYCQYSSVCGFTAWTRWLFLNVESAYLSTEASSHVVSYSSIRGINLNPNKRIIYLLFPLFNLDQIFSAAVASTTARVTPLLVSFFCWFLNQWKSKFTENIVSQDNTISRLILLYRAAICIDLAW